MQTPTPQSFDEAQVAFDALPVAGRVMLQAWADMRNHLGAAAREASRQAIFAANRTDIDGSHLRAIEAEANAAVARLEAMASRFHPDGATLLDVAGP